MTHNEPYIERNIGIEMHGGRAIVLLPAGSRLPAARAMTFTTVADGQRAVEVRVVRCGSSGRVDGVVGRFLVAGLRPGPGGGARIDIGISLDREGVIRAWGADRHTGTRQEAAFSGLWALPSEFRPLALSLLEARLGAELSGTDVAGAPELRQEAEALMPPGGDDQRGPFLAALVGEAGSRRRSALEPPVSV